MFYRCLQGRDKTLEDRMERMYNNPTNMCMTIVVNLAGMYLQLLTWPLLTTFEKWEDNARECIYNFWTRFIYIGVIYNFDKDILIIVNLFVDNTT